MTIRIHVIIPFTSGIVSAPMFPREVAASSEIAAPIDARVWQVLIGSRPLPGVESVHSTRVESTLQRRAIRCGSTSICRIARESVRTEWVNLVEPLSDALPGACRWLHPTLLNANRFQAAHGPRATTERVTTRWIGSAGCSCRLMLRLYARAHAQGLRVGGSLH